MINIWLAQNSGFCFGVKRAIRLAEETAKKYGNAMTIGPIIHNPQVVEKLSNAGVKTIEDLNNITDQPVIIRSHGIPIQTIKLLNKKKCTIIDATCPFVEKAHQFAKIADKEKYQIIILGNPKHPEIIALKSYVKANVIICENANSLPDTRYPKIAIICQTTQNINTLKKLTNKIIKNTNELRIFNTICDATNIRQHATLQLAKKCDIMIVIGGKNSSNTKMLAKLSKKVTKTIHIEKADELNIENLKQNINIGLTAGASTPDWIILDVYNKIKQIVDPGKSNAQKVEDIPGYMEETNAKKNSKHTQ